MNPSACCNSGPDVSDGRGQTSELRRSLHSENQRVHSQKVCNETQRGQDVMREDTLLDCLTSELQIFSGLTLASCPHEGENMEFNMLTSCPEFNMLK